MRAPCHPSMRTWERFSVLLLCSCPFMSSAVCCPPRVLGGAWGWGLLWLRQSPFCSPALRGCVFLEALSAARAVAGAGASVRLRLWSWLGCPPDPQEDWLCRPASAALASLPGWGACCGARKTACHQSPKEFLYKVILILKSLCVRMKRLPVACLGCQAYRMGRCWCRAAEWAAG